MKKLILTSLAALLLIGCRTDSAVVSHNLSKDAEMFRIDRRIIFYNSIRDVYMLSIEGRCAIEADRMDNQLEVTCRTSDTTYKKHFLGISDNVTYFVEQLESAQASKYHYKVHFSPKTIVPDVDIR